MLINILDVNLQKVAFLSNDVPGLPNYYDDEFHEYRDQGAATFKFTVKKVINNKLQSYARFLNGQSYFSFQIDGNDYLMTPASEQAIHETSEEISFFCVSLDRELMSEQANPLVNTSSHNIQWYFDQMGLISNTQITIGINEVSNLTRTINYDGQETKLARLISVIGNFDAEFEFITKLNNDGSLNSVTLNIYKENDGLNIQGVGKKRDDVRLIFGENIQAVERDVSTEGFLNATTVTGADNLNWNSASFSYINADGVEEFYKRAGSDTAFAPLSAKIYPAQLSKDKDDIWTRIDFTTEYKSVNDMWAYAVRQFKQYAYHQVSYTVTPSSKLVNAEIGDGPPLAKGDTVIIQDNNYIDIDGNVGLLLSARVSEKIVSETHPENNKLIFSNYKKLKSEVSTDIQAIVNQLVDAATPYRAELTTTNGTQFKNGTGSTTLAAHIFKGSATTETITDSYEWSKDGTVVANVQEITVDASGVSDKAVYSFKATVAGKVVASQSVTITNVDDGTNGRSVTNVSQKWRLTTTTATPTQAWSDAGWLTTQPTTTATNKYLWSITRTTFNLAPLTQDVIEQKAVYGDKGDKGDTGNDGRAGKDGVGINSTTITYAISSSGTVTPTAGWNSQVPTLVKGQYLWTKTVWNYSDGTSESGYTVSYIAKDGNNGHDGIAGKDGVGITATTITYAQSTSGTTAPSSGWTTSVPTVPAGQFLWTKTVWSYSDKTSETGYSVAMMGAKGDKGDQGVQGIQGVDGRQGIPGPKGADGKTQYTHIAYANSADGVTDFSTSDSNRAYIGMYVDFNINDSTTPSDYSWTLVKGADGTQGTPGKPGADGKTPYFHTAWSYSADGKDRFTTVYPNLNLLDGTRNFSGTWTNSSSWVTDGTYKGLTVKKRTGQWNGIYKTFTAPKDGIYTFSAYVKGSGIDSKIYRFLSVNGVVNGTVMPDTLIGNNFDWLRDSFTVTLKANDVVYAKYEIVGSGTDSILWTAGHKWEEGSTATPYMPSASEVTTADWPSYIGQYSDFTQADSTNPSDYTWSLIRGNDGKDGDMGKSVWSYPYDRGANRLGSWWSDLKPTPTTDNPPKVGDTIIDLVGKIYQITNVVVDSTIGGGGLFDYGPMLTSIKGADGSPGKDGIAGKDGVGLKSTIITYGISASDSTMPGTWSQNTPALVKGQWFWTKTQWTYTDNSTETGYQKTYISKDGNNGHDGIAGKDGTGIKTTTITYAGSTSGTTAPNTGWTTTVPTVAAGNYLWTKTVWDYTDKTSETGYSVAKMGNNGTPGPQGPPGSNGDPGKTVSNTEPTTRFKGLTWKYSGTTDLTASDRTVIKPNTEYYYNGTHWVINYFSVNNFAAESITSDKIDGKNLTITDGEFISKTSNGPVTTSTEIKDNHIAISKKDGTVNTRNDIALDSEQGLAQKFTNINTGFYRTAGINYQGPFTSDSDGNYAQLTPQGTKLSTDVPWTKLSLMNNFNGNIEYAIINGTVYISASGVGVPAMTAGQWKQAAQLPTGSSAIPIRANRIAAGDSGDGLSWALLSNQAGGIFIRCSANKAPTPNLFNATLPYPIG
ncbi:capsid and scaffold [Lactococcus phage D7893]